MESFTVKAKFLSSNKGFFSRLWRRDHYGTVTLQLDNKMTMTGYDKVYAAIDVREVVSHYEGDGVGYVEVRMHEDGEDFSRFVVYHEDAYMFYAWLIRQEVELFGKPLLQERDDVLCAHLERPVLKLLREWQAEDDKRIRRPADDLVWEEVDETFRQWVLTDCAIIHMANGEDRQELGGGPKDNPVARECGRQLLRDSWGINSRLALIETIFDMAENHDLWQMQRIIQNVSYGYLAGYITLRETLNVILTCGKRLQDTVSSWEELGKDYLHAFKTNLGSESVAYERREKALAWLLEAEDSPYRKVPFAMELCKSW